MNLNKTYLVVGAAGMIGGALVKHIRLCSEEVIAADIWHDNLVTQQIFLDLASDPSIWNLPVNIKTAYICAGITKLEDCRRDATFSYNINVNRTLALIYKLIEQGAFVVFLSSSKVFDGSIPNVRPQTLQNPMCEYGRQKADVERILLRDYPDQTAIVRMTKIFGRHSVINIWKKKLLSGEVIHPILDMVVSPIPLQTVVTILKTIGDQRLSGIWQISGEQDISYSNAAYLGANLLNIDSKLIQPHTTCEANLHLETNPINTTLDCERIINCLGILPPPVRWSIEYAFRQ